MLAESTKTAQAPPMARQARDMMRLRGMSRAARMLQRFFVFAATIRWASRDFVRAAALGWMTRLTPARSSLVAARRASASALAMSPAATAARTLRIWVLIADLAARFFARRSRLWRRCFLALLVCIVT